MRKCLLSYRLFHRQHREVVSFDETGQLPQVVMMKKKRKRNVVVLEMILPTRKKNGRKKTIKENADKNADA